MSLKPENWDLEVDLVCVGSGLGGITAAIVAHDLGKKAVVLEKAPKLGGVSAYSGGQVWLPNNHKMAEEGFTDSCEDGKTYLDFLAAGYNDPDMLDRMLESAPRALEYLENEAGVKWRCIKGFPDYYYPHAPGTCAEGRYLETEMFSGPELGEWQDKTYISQIFPGGMTHAEMLEWGGISGCTKWDFEKIAANMEADLRGFGSGLMGFLVKAAVIDRGIPAYVDTPVCELITEDGKVIGVRAEKQGRDFFVRGQNGVVLAIGGYDYNEELAKYYEHLPEWRSMCMPEVAGDHVMLGGEIGAAMAAVPPHNLGTLFGYNIPGEEHPDGTTLYRWSIEGGCPHAIWVNREGMRFCDETFYKEFQPRVKIWDGLSQEYPNYPPYLIFDQNFCENYPVGTFMPGDDIPETLAIKADTPQALPQKLGIDAEQFDSTIARYNKLCEEGVDKDFGRGNYPSPVTFMGDMSRDNPTMGPLNKPPYRGIPLVPVSFGVNAGGLKTDVNAQVVHVRGNAIEGLYAVGNSAAALDSGAGYQSGLANLRGIAWGYIAARHAAGVGNLEG